MQTKNELVVRSIAITEEAETAVLIKKKTHKTWKIHYMDFAEHFRKSDVSENSKVYHG